MIFSAKQNTKKLNEVKLTADVRTEQKTTHQYRVIENKLYLAEQNREKEIQKKLENIRKHVGFCFCLISVTLVLFNFHTKSFMLIL